MPKIAMSKAMQKDLELQALISKYMVLRKLDKAHLAST